MKELKCSSDTGSCSPADFCFFFLTFHLFFAQSLLIQTRVRPRDGLGNNYRLQHEEKKQNQKEDVENVCWNPFW